MCLNSYDLSAIYDGSQGVLDKRIVYQYDHLDRLISAKAEGGVLVGYDLGFEYDAVGNMTARTAVGLRASYQYTGPQPHAVTTVGDNRYTYDANGNMVIRSEDAITYAQRWNAFNKLAQVKWQWDGQACNVQFVYDGDGNRLIKIEGGTGLEITTYYAGQMFEKQFNTTANQLGEGQSTNANCSGRAIGMTDYAFTGQRNEMAFGLMDFNARYYSPRLGRFISPDSIIPDPTTGKGFNRYLYADGNPLLYNDPSGHCSANMFSSDRDENQANSECWGWANTILASWDQTSYWSDRYTSKEVFREYVATTESLNAAFFQQEFSLYMQSDAYQTWQAQQPVSRPDPNAADPQCAGDRICQALVQHAVQVSNQAEKLCHSIDCVAVGNDVIGVSGAILLVASPLCGPAAPACATAGGSISTGSTIFGVGWTLNSWSSGNASNADLLVLMDATIKSAKSSDPRVGLAIDLIQLGWDAWGSSFVNSRTQK